MPVSDFAFLELKRRLMFLEQKHNDLTTVCLVLARQVRELKGDPVDKKHSSKTTLKTLTKKTTEQLLKERINARNADVKEVKFSRRVQRQVVESESEEESEESEEEVVEEPPKKVTKKTLTKKTTRKAPAKKTTKKTTTKRKTQQTVVVEDANEEDINNDNVAVEIVDSMAK
jgi:hypothetical protein